LWSQFYQECTCQHENDTTSSPDDEHAKMAFLITLHNERTLLDALYLFRAIRSPYSYIAIHIDTKLEFDKYQDSLLYHEIHDCPCGSISYVDSVYSAEWGKWSMNDPTLWGMNVFTNHAQFKNAPWEVFINLSADSLPVYSPHILAQMFADKKSGLQNVNFVTSSVCETGLLPTPITWFPENWHKRRAYDPSQHKPLIYYNDEVGEAKSFYIPTYFGSQWMTLTRSFVEFITHEMDRSDSLVSRYAEYLQESEFLMTDETFFASLLMSISPFNKTQIPKLNLIMDGGLIQRPEMYAIRYERMDEHGPSASGFFPDEQRYEVSETGHENDVDDPRVWGPYFLGVYDLANIKRSGALFIRKVSIFVEPNLYNMLPVEDVKNLPNIEWVDLKISEFPDWEKLKARLIEKAKKRMQKEQEERDRREIDSTDELL